MKTITKALLLLIIILSLSSCEQRGVHNPILGDENYTIKIIDGCEYLERYEGYQNGYTFTHKGDCKNPIHYRIIHDTIYIKK